MNYLLFYLLGCSFAYPITKIIFKSEILDDTIKFQEQQINNKKFDQKFFKKAILIIFTFTSWIIVSIFLLLKLQLLYYIILNLFKK
jgi:hypothetical protein